MLACFIRVSERSSFQQKIEQPKIAEIGYSEYEIRKLTAAIGVWIQNLTSIVPGAGVDVDDVLHFPRLYVTGTPVISLAIMHKHFL